MPKQFKRNVLCEEKKHSVLALLAEGYSEHQVVFHSITFERQSYRPVKGENNTSLTGMTANLFECQHIRMSLKNCRMTSSDLQKEWQTAAGVKCMARTVWNWLLEAGLKSCKARKKLFINEKQRKPRLRFAKDHKLDHRELE